MKLFKSLAGIAAVLSVVPYKVETKECEGKKSYSLTSLTWKADYIPETADKEAALNIDLLGGLTDTVKCVKDLLTKEANEELCETEMAENAPDSQEETI